MKDQLLRFIDALRAAGISATVAETIDATHAVVAAGFERNIFREALAATLIKDEADRPVFDAVFEQFFSAPDHRTRQNRRPPNGSEAGSGGPGGEQTGQTNRPRREEPPPESTTGHRETREAMEHQHASTAGRVLAHHQALQRTPLQELSTREVEECDLLVAVLAQQLRRRLRRRQRVAPRGRLDMRRTLRRSAATGGVPIKPALRRRRPRRPNLIALCDHSHSVAIASHFLIGLLLPSAAFFRRVRLFAFVDRPVEVSIEVGRLIPHTPLDLYARSDFGHVLVEFWESYRSLITRNTRVVVLGDARNNRRPPRGDILAKIHAAAAQVVWLNPEPRQRWNSGDSVANIYRRRCDEMLSAGSLRELASALKGVLEP